MVRVSTGSLVLILVCGQSLIALDPPIPVILNGYNCVTKENGIDQCANSAIGVQVLVDELFAPPLVPTIASLCSFGELCRIVNQNPICKATEGGAVTTATLEYTILNSGASTIVPAFVEKQANDPDKGFGLKTLDVIACFSISECKCIKKNGNNVCTKGKEFVYQLARYEIDRRVLCEVAPVVLP